MALLVKALVAKDQRGFGDKLGPVLILGVVNSGLPFLLFAIAAARLPAGYIAILNGTAPLMGVILGGLLFRERMTLRKVGGVVIGLIGVSVLTQAGPVQATPAVLASVGACLISAMCFGLAVFLAQRWIHSRGGLNSNVIAFGSQVGAALFLAPVFAGDLLIESPPLIAVTATVLGSMLALGLMCTSIAYVLYFRLIADVGPIKALSVAFLIPVFGVLWGWLFLSEPVSWAHLAGGGLVGVAIWLVVGARSIEGGKSPSPLPFSAVNTAKEQ